MGFVLRAEFKRETLPSFRAKAHKTTACIEQCFDFSFGERGVGHVERDLDVEPVNVATLDLELHGRLHGRAAKAGEHRIELHSGFRRKSCEPLGELLGKLFAGGLVPEVFAVRLPLKFQCGDQVRHCSEVVAIGAQNLARRFRCAAIADGLPSIACVVFIAGDGVAFRKDTDVQIFAIIPAVLYEFAVKNRTQLDAADAARDSRRRGHSDALQQSDAGCRFEGFGRNLDLLGRLQPAEWWAVKNRVAGDVERRRSIEHDERGRRHGAVGTNERNAIVRARAVVIFHTPRQRLLAAHDGFAFGADHAGERLVATQQCVENADAVGRSIGADGFAAVAGVECEPDGQRTAIERSAPGEAFVHKLPVGCLGHGLEFADAFLAPFEMRALGCEPHAQFVFLFRRRCRLPRSFVEPVLPALDALRALPRADERIHFRPVGERTHENWKR